MLLILARHGNTFGPDDTPVWVGAQEDYPLVDTGLVQSRDIGRALRDTAQLPDRIITGPLKRTRIGAELIAEHCGFSAQIEIDDRLREIDYGSWGGKTDDEVAAQWSWKAINDWREHSIPPIGAGWEPSPQAILENITAFYRGITQDRHTDQTVLVMTSNGILRYFYALIASNDAPPEQAKVKTGRICAAHITPKQTQMLFWNLKPSDYVEQLIS